MFGVANVPNIWHLAHLPHLMQVLLCHNSDLTNNPLLFSFFLITHDNRPYQSYNKSYVHIFSYCLFLEKIHAHDFVPHFLRYVLLFFAIFVNIFVMWWETKHISYIALFRTRVSKTRVSLKSVCVCVCVCVCVSYHVFLHRTQISEFKMRPHN